MQSEIFTDVCILGAGISGLTARRFLKDHGHHVMLFEKSRGVGGRMSTRRGENYLADLGAQFSSVRNPAWAKILTNSAQPLIKIKILESDQYQRYIHPLGMSSMTKLLLSDQEKVRADDVFLGERIQKIHFNSGFEILTDADRQVRARILIMTAPVPQSLALLDDCGKIAFGKEFNPLRQIEYDPCLAVVALLKNGDSLESPGILKDPSPKLAGIYDQKAKGLKSEKSVFVVHASAEWSRDLWQNDDISVSKQIWEETRRTLGRESMDLEVAELNLHRWRYCQPMTIYPSPCFIFQFPKSLTSFSSTSALLFAGDAFGQSSVDGAMSSGWAAGESAHQLLRI
jgi:renalase